jgi:AraC-like DNA-binding protein
MDTLADVLGSVRLSSGAFLDARLTAPWCILSQVGPEDCLPLGRVPAHIVAYHYVATGGLSIQVAEHAPLEVRAGELLLLPRNDRHVLASAPGLRPVVIDHLIQVPAGHGPALLHHGGGGALTQIVCGFLGCEVAQSPLLAALPPLLKLDASEGLAGIWIATSFAHAAAEFAAHGAAAAPLLGKLAELLFAEAIRRYLATLPAAQTGWLAGLRDRLVGPALALLHAQPAHPWTTEALAGRVGLSRSAFAERFTTLIGMPPMRYLAQWRLQLAAARLRESNRSMAQLAYEVGYQSEASFARAFKQAFGTSPGAWRNRRAGA